MRAGQLTASGGHLTSREQLAKWCGQRVTPGQRPHVLDVHHCHVNGAVVCGHLAYLPADRGKMEVLGGSRVPLPREVARKGQQKGIRHGHVSTERFLPLLSELSLPWQAQNWSS